MPERGEEQEGAGQVAGVPESFEALDGSRRRLWVVSSGGHLVQALRIEDSLAGGEATAWITSDVPQARSLLQSRRAYFVPYVAPRDIRGSVRVARTSKRVARHEGSEMVLSTGAGAALVALPLLRAAGLSAIFIESLARRDDHSLTGNLLARFGSIQTLTQYPSAASKRWRYEGSVIGAWRAVEGRTPHEHPGLRIFVTLGTIRPFGFTRAVRAVESVLGPQDEVVWQIGFDTMRPVAGTVHEAMDWSAVREAMEWGSSQLTV